MPGIRRTTWLASAGLALAVGAWWIAGTGDPPLPPRADASHPGTAFWDAMPLPAVATQAAPSPAVAEPATHCPGQSLLLALTGRAPERRCATPTGTRRHGETVVHELQGSGGVAGWTLRLDIIGRDMHRITLTDARGQRYGCVRDEGGCAGVAVIDSAAAPVTRSIALDHTLLRPLPPPRPKGLRAADLSPSMFEVPANATPLRISARLQAPLGEAVAAPCAAALTLASSHGRVTSFCADAGNEQGPLPDGGELVGFLPYDGPPLRVRVDASGQVWRVEMGALACEGATCSGVSLDAAEPGLRSVSFAGTTLMRTGTGGSTESVALNGRLPLP